MKLGMKKRKCQSLVAKVFNLFMRVLKTMQMILNQKKVENVIKTIT